MNYWFCPWTVGSVFERWFCVFGLLILCLLHSVGSVCLDCWFGFWTVHFMYLNWSVLCHWTVGSVSLDIVGSFSLDCWFCVFRLLVLCLWIVGIVSLRCSFCVSELSALCLWTLVGSVSMDCWFCPWTVGSVSSDCWFCVFGLSVLYLWTLRL